MSKIYADKEHKETVSVAVYNQDGDFEYFGSSDTLNGHGNSTWRLDKKPFSLSLSEASSLLGMKSAKKWILLANMADQTHMRNKLIYDFAELTGLEWSPKCEYADLYLNGEYNGLYLISEKIEFSENRLNINPQAGYLYDLEFADRLRYTTDKFLTAANQSGEIKNPKPCSEEQLNFISDFVQNAEDAILSENSISDNEESYLNFIDLDSWVRKYLIEEVFLNQDAGAASQYFYCDSSAEKPKIFAGPVWDYDLSLGNGYVSLKNPECFRANQKWKARDIYTPWYASLYQKQAFYNRLAEIYKIEFLPLLENMIHNSIDDMEKRLLDAVYMNSIRWQCAIEPGANIKSFLRRRIDFLNSAWLENINYNTVRIDTGIGDYFYYSLKDGDFLTDLPDTDQISGFVGWYDENTGQEFDFSQPITADKNVYAKTHQTKIAKLTHFIWVYRKILLYIAFVCIMMIFLAIFIWTDYKRNTRKEAS